MLNLIWFPGEMYHILYTGSVFKTEIKEAGSWRPTCLYTPSDNVFVRWVSLYFRVGWRALIIRESNLAVVVFSSGEISPRSCAKITRLPVFVRFLSMYQSILSPHSYADLQILYASAHYYRLIDPSPYVRPAGVSQVYCKCGKYFWKKVHQLNLVRSKDICHSSAF